MTKIDLEYKRRVEHSISRLKRYFESYPGTLIDLAKEVGVRLVTMRKWWDGLHYPRESNLEKLERFVAKHR
jgi:hypothetical protein